MSYPIRNGYKKVSGLFAFWRYDLFPHVLGGPVMAMNDIGNVQVETYGGSCFCPIKLVPKAQGEKMLARIKKLEHEHRAAKLAFTAEWRQKIVDVLPEANRDDELRDYMRDGEEARARR